MERFPLLDLARAFAMTIPTPWPGEKSSEYNHSKVIDIRMAKILILYSSTDGHTKKICHRLQEVIEQQAANRVVVVSLHDEHQIDLASFDKIIIGASIRYGKHSPLVFDFIKRNSQLLNRKPNAFFSVNVVARKPDKNQPGTNPYLQKFLRQITWQPKNLAVFAGKIDYPSYSFFDRLMIRLIMLMTSGPTNPKAVIDFTDWQQVETFGRVINDMESF